jgi:MFS family permease
VIGEWTVKNNDMGWRWTMWLSLILGMALWILAIPTTTETFAPIILQRKAARMRFETKNWALHSKRDEEPVEYGYLARKYGIRPLQMLVQEPILAAITAYMALVYAIIYLTFFAYPFSFEMVRGWETGVGSLPFFALLIGYLGGCGAAILESRFRFRKLLEKHDGDVPPEQRIPPMFVGSVLIVVGLFWFGWTSSPKVSWVPQVISGVAIGSGIFMVFMPGQVYLMDIYKQNAASALAGNAFVRAALACAFPLIAGPMYDQLGVEWATSLLGFLCLALAPFPVVFYIYGKKVRSWSRYVIDAT